MKTVRRGTAPAVRKSSPKQLIAAVHQAAKPRSGELAGSAQVVARFGAAVEQVDSIPITLTLREACSLIGEGVEPRNFAATAFDALAREIEAVAALDGSGTDIEAWRPLLTLSEKARFAAKIEAQLTE